MGDCYDKAALSALRRPILECTKGYKGCYSRAYRCLEASAAIFEDIRSTLLTDTLTEKLAKRARGILSRELPVKKGAVPGKVKQRFLGAVTHRGSLCLYDTALAQCGRVYELSDHYGLAHELLVHLLTGAVERGYDAVACLDPMAPGRLAHLLIPERDLAFLSTNAAHTLPVKPARRIRIDAAADKTLLSSSRPRLHFARKVSSALLEEGISSLAQAKAMHDELEAIYNPYVDFDLVEETAASFIQEFAAL